MANRSRSNAAGVGIEKVTRSADGVIGIRDLGRGWRAVVNFLAGAPPVKQSTALMKWPAVLAALLAMLAMHPASGTVQKAGFAVGATSIPAGRASRQTLGRQAQGGDNQAREKRAFHGDGSS